MKRLLSYLLLSLLLVFTTASISFSQIRTTIQLTNYDIWDGGYQINANGHVVSSTRDTSLH